MDNPQIDNADSVNNPSPFIAFTARTIPATFDTSMSYQEALFALVNYLQTQVTPVVNGNATITNQQTKAIQDLYDFVNHYFDNLDVQEEINNKLDEMADSGELAEIIAQYANLGCVFGYHTIADMASASNLKAGSIVKVLGKTNDNTGDGSFYKIRTRTNADEPDGINVVVIQDTENLVAQIIPNYFVNQEALARQSADTNLQNQINNLVTPPRKYIFISDSYGGGWSPDGTVEGWIERLVNKLGLTSSDYISRFEGGYAFGRSSEYNFYGLLNALTDDEDVTDIIVGGGYNDRYSTETAITEGITAFANLAKTKFPNAKLHIAFMGWSKNGDAKSDLRVAYQYYKNACDTNKDILFIKNIQYTLHDYFNCWSSDGYHPNANGHEALAVNMYKYLTQGEIDVSYNRNIGSITFVNSGGAGGTWEAISNIHNDITSLIIVGTGTFVWTSGNEITISGKALIEIGTLNSGVMVGDETESCCATTNCVCQLSDNTYRTLPLTIIIKNGKIYVRSALINNSHTNYDSYTIKAIQLGSINISINSMFA